MGGITDEDITAYMRSVAADVNASVSSQLHDPEFATVYELLSYQTLSGGKRLRPAVAVTVGQCLGGDYRELVDAATTCELVHEASLLGDNIIDGDEFRRGKPSAHAVFGVASAVMGSYLLATLAVRLGFRRNVAVGKILNDVIHALAVGNAEEILTDGVASEERYLRIIGGKTASLFRAPAMLGAVLAYADPDRLRAAETYGLGIGMMYQLLDDLIDVLKSLRSGKPAGDLANGTVTLALAHAYRETQSEEFHGIVERMKMKQALTPKQFLLLRWELEATSAIEHVESLAARHREAALDALKAFPENRFRDVLVALPGFMERALRFEVENGDEP